MPMGSTDALAIACEPQRQNTALCMRVGGTIAFESHCKDLQTSATAKQQRSTRNQLMLLSVYLLTETTCENRSVHDGSGHSKALLGQHALTGAAGLVMIGFGLVLNSSLLRTTATTCVTQGSHSCQLASCLVAVSTQ